MSYQLQKAAELLKVVCIRPFSKAGFRDFNVPVIIFFCILQNLVVLKERAIKSLNVEKKL